MSERIGILTGGGDCPGLNAVTVAVKITEAVGRRRTVLLNEDIVQTARALGISFGD